MTENKFKPPVEDANASNLKVSHESFTKKPSFKLGNPETYKRVPRISFEPLSDDEGKKTGIGR